MLSISPERLIEIVRGITSESAEERHVWASVPGYWCDSGELYGDEVPVLAAVLAWAALIETEIFAVREGLLSSLDSFTVLDLVPTEVLELVTSGLSREKLDIAEVEAYDTLVAKLGEHRGRSTPR